MNEQDIYAKAAERWDFYHTGSYAKHKPFGVDQMGTKETYIRAAGDREKERQVLLAILQTDPLTSSRVLGTRNPEEYDTNGSVVFYVDDFSPATLVRVPQGLTNQMKDLRKDAPNVKWYLSQVDFYVGATQMIPCSDFHKAEFFILSPK